MKYFEPARNLLELAWNLLEFLWFWLSSSRGAFVVYSLGALWLIHDYRAARYSSYLIFAMMIAGGVGAVEIMGRYRQAPLRALMSGSGFAFVVVNVAAAAVAWYLLHVMGWMESLTPSRLKCVKMYGYCEDQNVKAAVIAGFGALVFLRASIFKVRVNDSDVGVGPAALLDSLLLIADRGVDRREAVARSRDVKNLHALVKEDKDKISVASLLGKYSLALMQNVDDRTRSDVENAIKEVLADQTTPDAIKLDIVALKLGVVVGPDVLEAAAAALYDRLAHAARVALDDATLTLANEIRAGVGAAAGASAAVGSGVAASRPPPSNPPPPS